MTCPKCGKELSEGAKFCMECGASLLQAIEPAAVPFEQGAVLAVEFGRSTSVNYTSAVEMARDLPNYREFGNGKGIRHYFEVELKNFASISELFELVRYWKSTTISVNGVKIPQHKILPVLFCYQERSKSYDPVKYCYGKDDAHDYNDNEIGCRHCGINPFGWEGLTGFGEMRRDGTFVVDKNRLIYEVAKNLEDYIICPALDRDKIERKLRSFPESINPRIDKGWEYITEWDDDKQAKVAISIRRKAAKKGGYTVGQQITEAVSASESGMNKASGTSGCMGCGCLVPIIVFLLVSAIIAIGLLV
ncbi:MAG: zinc-ribbon domain-containing protein [Patescibacteria group bacterium]